MPKVKIEGKKLSIEYLDFLKNNIYKVKLQKKKWSLFLNAQCIPNRSEHKWYDISTQDISPRSCTVKAKLVISFSCFYDFRLHISHICDTVSENPGKVICCNYYDRWAVIVFPVFIYVFAFLLTFVFCRIFVQYIISLSSLR